MSEPGDHPPRAKVSSRSLPDRLHHRVDDLVALVAETFGASDQLRLEPGGAEPLYLPPERANGPARLICRDDYFASALHELAHWCIAGCLRRSRRDFGYHYLAGPRGFAEQCRFIALEAKTQALEWLLADACRWRFRISPDNLDGPALEARMWRAVTAERARWLQRGLPVRAAQLHARLLQRYAGGGEGVAGSANVWASSSDRALWKTG